LPRRSGQVALLATLFVLYGSFYLCRANLEAAGPLLIAAGKFDKTSFGALTTIATFTYAVGKFVMGAAGDALGARRLLALCIAGSVVCSLAFGASGAFAAFALFAASNRFFQSGGWSAVVKLVGLRFERRRHGTVMGILSTSYELGNVVALNVSSLVARRGWQALFLVNPLLFALVGGAAVSMLGRQPRREPERMAAHAGPALPPASPASTRAALRAVFRQGAFWLAVTLSALLTFIRMAFLTWTPTYLYEVSRAAGSAELSGSIARAPSFPPRGPSPRSWSGPGATGSVRGGGRR